MKPSAALRLHRSEVRSIVAAYYARNARAFGSAASGEDTEASDLGVLVDTTPETTLMDIGAIRYELRKLLGVPVDVLTPRALPDAFRERVLTEALPV